MGGRFHRSILADRVTGLSRWLGGENHDVSRPGGAPRIILLANPGSGRADDFDAQEALRRLGATVHVLAIQEHEAAAGLDADRVAVAGGDGSIGWAAETASRLGAPLTVIPVGTANDFARCLELPSDPDEACRLAVEGMETRRLDLGRMDGRPFVNVASAGLAPIAAREASGLKRMLGPLAYAVGAIRAGLGADPVDARVSCDDEELFSGAAWQVTVACTGAFGAGASVDADPGDGMLDAVAIEAASRAALVVRAYGMRAGRVESQRGVRSCRGRRVEVDVDPGTEFNLDGEVIRADDTRFSVDPSAFELVVG
jgi:diacylglycerol kinase (ATP)